MSRSRQHDAGLELAAWAKVNLWLHVLGRRPDGYHTLDSLIVFAGIGDALILEPAEDLSLEVSGPFAAEAPAGEGNLVLRAAALLREAVGDPGLGARVRLEKRLPVAAGIGGGSSDAAVALLGLARLWGLTFGPSELKTLARPLGSDLSVCLFGRPALVGGIGETIRRAPPLPACWLALVNPGVPLSTPTVYGARSGPFSAPVPALGELGTLADLVEALSGTRNDLEAPARALCPAVETVLAALSESLGCRLARMSGSGATCFGLFASELEAQSAATAIRQAEPAWWAAAGPLLHGPLGRP